jgi:RsiW-degrading membrane proteinase PrsW (M82 family)
VRTLDKLGPDRCVFTANLRGVHHPALPQQAPPPLALRWPTKVRSVGAPLAAIILMGTVVALILVLITAANPGGAVLGFVLTTIAMGVVVAAYLWLDRWEPEPPRLLIMAFLWGASVAVILSVALEVVFEAAVNPEATTETNTSFFTVAVGAPLIEEAAKGLFLLVMMTGRRRHELNSLTDCLVFAGLVGAGFAWIEDIFYIASGETLGASLATAALRLVMAPFGHSLFTTMTAIGVWFALQHRERLVRFAYIFAGYLGAVFLHGLWNGAALLGPGAYFGIYLLWMVPLFVTAIILAVRSRHREQQIVAAKLPGMVAAGLLTPNEATWLGSLRERKTALQVVTVHVGRPAARGVKQFAAQVVELAYAQDRIDRGFGDARVVAHRNEETHRLYAARAHAAPTLLWMTNYRVNRSSP